MGIPSKTEERRTARGKLRSVVSEARPAWRVFFDTPYNRELHHRILLNDIKGMVKRNGSKFDLRLPRIAKPWHNALLRNAPMLNGFFADEPAWRDKLLRWCEKVLTGDKADKRG
jgi:hypothetical protein